MIIPHFEWDEAKNTENQKKHRVSFQEAQTAFHDENGKRYFDEEHSAHEDRFILLGMSMSARILVVCHCYREPSSVIRIISARKADKRESRFYLGRQS